MLRLYNAIEDRKFHTESVQKVIEHFNSDIDGLSIEEAVKRLGIYGRNELDEGRKKTIAGMFFEQFKNIMVLILLAAAVISGFMHELTDTFIILIVVTINAVLGVVQESKAEKALTALKKMSSPTVRVKRGKSVTQVKTELIVPGDIVLLEAGDYVPADMRLINISSLKAEEAALTGESVPVEKIVDVIEKEDLVIGDRKNMAYSGSIITYGRGMGVVTATGMNTEVGKIAKHITSAETNETPLQKKLGEMSKYLTIGILAVSAVIFLAGVFQGREYFHMFLTAVSLAVAAIPEGLPAVITIVLAMGVQKMAGRNAIVRKLSAVETLGSTEIICSDKTGTLTQNKMTVKEVFYDNALGSGNEGTSRKGIFELLVNFMLLCNDTRLSKNNEGSRSLVGDPTETALVDYAFLNGVDKETADTSFPRLAEIPFDSGRKLMTTVNKWDGTIKSVTKGAPDVLLGKCSRILLADGIKELTDTLKDEIIKANSQMASKALRVLAIAYRDLPSKPAKATPELLENDLVFIGLVGMIDPPRPEAKEAVRVCAEAGIRPVMITGDHRDTAFAIAKELGIIKDESQVITGAELNTISDEDFEKRVSDYSVYARVSPEHKVRIVNAWKKKGKIVAMTGDGVNDAPALKSSDIGIGMGITGTDVAKGISNMVLADDNFATIVVAVEEGRKIYSNIRKSIQFLLSSNLGEVVTLFIATMLNWTILFPIHILWVNLITDTLPALALGVEKAEKNIMRQRPRRSSSSFFSDGVGVSIIYQGIIKGLITLGVFYAANSLYSNGVAITMAFATLGLIQLTHSLNVRSNKKSLFSIGIFSNAKLTAAIAVSAILQIMVIVLPFFNGIFKVEQLNLEQWLIVIISSIAIIPVVELGKLIALGLDKRGHGPGR